MGLTVWSSQGFYPWGFYHCLPSDNNRIWKDSGLVPKSYEEILDKKGVRNIGASGTVS